MFIHYKDRDFDQTDVLNGATNKNGSPSPLTSPIHKMSKLSFFHKCCGRCCAGKRYKVNDISQ